ncbi:MAG TPA: thioredoxin domain-containing protein [Nitrospira sp.]|nr:thioredoxin domain-containing protein [Nitrospira sp.]
MVKKRWSSYAAVALGLAALCLSSAAAAATPELKGKFELLKDERSTHQPGRVKVVEFADFYCPHCHHFEEAGLPVIQKEFGNKVEATMVGFPVFRNKLPTPFDMYEQAKLMGKGDEMKKVLFRTIHQDKITGVLDRSIREALVKEVGLNPKTFEEGLASGKPAKAFEEGKQWGERIKVQYTPTLLLDGNIKIEGDNMKTDNIITVIRSILENDAKK